MKRLAGYCLFVFVCLLAASRPVAGQAVGISGDALYEARVVLEDRSTQTRQEGIREAGRIVLTRITGERHPDRVESLTSVLEDIDGLVQRFQWESTESGDPRLWVRFDAGAVDRAVRDSGHALWGRERPRVLVWLAIRDESDRDLLTEGDVTLRAPNLADAARQRGLPLIFPLMDLEDRSEVSFADVWGGFDERVLEASSRYSPNAILIGRVEAAGGGDWRGRWSLYQPDGVLRWRSQPAPRGEILGEGVHEAANRLARRFAVAGDMGSGDAIRLRVRGLSSVEDYVRAERHLQDLTPVEAVQLQSLTGDGAVFRIQSRGGRISLEQAIELRGELIPVESEPAESQDSGLTGLVPVETVTTYRLRQ